MSIALTVLQVEKLTHHVRGVPVVDGVDASPKVVEGVAPLGVKRVLPGTSDNPINHLSHAVQLL